MGSSKENGLLYFYGRKGISAPYPLIYGKTTLGSLSDCKVCIKKGENIFCLIDSNEAGVAVLTAMNRKSTRHASLSIESVETNTFKIRRYSTGSMILKDTAEKAKISERKKSHSPNANLKEININSTVGSIYESPLPGNRKTYSGNRSDVFVTYTTPVSKKTLWNFKNCKNLFPNVPEVNTTLKASIKTRPIVEEITPVNSLSSDYLQEFLKTPRVQKSPKNDLTNVAGVKKILKTPKVQRSPKNDLTNVAGVKKILRTPKVQKSPKNDLTNVAGVKKILKTPKVQKSPKNDLTDVTGVKNLLKTPKRLKSCKQLFEDTDGKGENKSSDSPGIKMRLRNKKQVQEPSENDESGQGLRRSKRIRKNVERFNISNF